MKSVRHLVLGAARSGKTRFALNTAKSLASTQERQVIYVATAEPYDDEMRERIGRHRAERPTNWRTLEAPRNLARALSAVDALASSEAVASSESRAPSEASARATALSLKQTHTPSKRLASPIIIVDCLTLWLSNAILRDFHEDKPTAALPTWAREREAFMHWLAGCEHTVVLVSNEVGGGVVPASALARRFQSEQGWLNQDIASICEQVTLVVAGLPVAIKAP